jgi:hypothetical protein
MYINVVLFETNVGRFVNGIVVAAVSSRIYFSKSL